MAYFIEFDLLDENQSTVIFQLSATTEAKINFKGNPTSNPVESGVSVADHYIIDNTSVSFNGVITNAGQLPFVKRQDGNGQISLVTSESKEWITQLEERRRNSEPFKLYIDDRVIPDCLFKTLSLTKNSQHGDGAWGIRFTAESINIVDQAAVGIVPLADFQRSLASLQRQNKAKQTVSDDEFGNLPIGARRVAQSAARRRAIVDAASTFLDSVFGGEE